MRTFPTRGSAILVRFLLVFFNALFALAGLVLLVFSVWALADEKSLRVIVHTRVFTTLALTGIAISVIAICAALLGLFGALKAVRWILVIFGALLLLFLVATLAAVVALYVFRGNVGKGIKTALLDSLKNDYTETCNNHKSCAIKDSWDWFQQTLRCCGVATNDSAPYWSWRSSRWYQQRMVETGGFTNGSASNGTAGVFGYVPHSCCVPSTPDGVVDPRDVSTYANRDKCLGINAYADFRGPPRIRIVGNAVNEAIFVDGCYRAFHDLIADEWHLVIVVSCVVALIAVQVIGLGLACHLCRRLKSSEQMELRDFSKNSGWR